MIFFRLRNNPQIPTKKRVKDTPKILNKLIGIFRLFLSSVRYYRSAAIYYYRVAAVALRAPPGIYSVKWFPLGAVGFRAIYISK